MRVITDDKERQGECVCICMHMCFDVADLPSLMTSSLFQCMDIFCTQILPEDEFPFLSKTWEIKFFCIVCKTNPPNYYQFTSKLKPLGFKVLCSV